MKVGVEVSQLKVGRVDWLAVDGRHELDWVHVRAVNTELGVLFPSWIVRVPVGPPRVRLTGRPEAKRLEEATTGLLCGLTA